MAGFQLEETIARSPEELFDILSNPERAADIVPNVTNMEKLTDGPVGVGARYRETRVIDGEAHETELEVVRYEPPTDYAVRNVTGGVETVYHYRLTPQGNGTRIVMEATVSGSGLRALVAPVLAVILKREDGDHLTQLKAAVEPAEAPGEQP